MKGGKREGAGRPKGVQNKKTVETVAAIEASGLTPLEFMLNVMREPIPDDADIKTKIAARMLRMDAAKSAAPYVHPRLASTELSTKDGKPLQVQLIQYANPDSSPLQPTPIPAPVLSSDGPRSQEGGAGMEPPGGKGSL